MSSASDVRVEFSLSESAELSALSRWLEGAGTRVDRHLGGINPGELGVPDVLAAVGSSGAMVTAIKVLPEYIRSRRPHLHIEATVNGERFILDANNADEQVIRMAERIVDAALGN